MEGRNSEMEAAMRRREEGQKQRNAEMKEATREDGRAEKKKGRTRGNDEA